MHDEFPPANGKDPELNKQFAFGNNLHKTQSGIRGRRQKGIKYNFHNIHK